MSLNHPAGEPTPASLTAPAQPALPAPPERPLLTTDLPDTQDPATHAAIRTRLLRRQGDLLSALESRLGGESRVEHAHEAVLPASPDDRHADATERSVDLALTDHERHALALVGAALARLDQGRYGCCADCGRHLPPARLEALPEAERCMPCESLHEAQGAGRMTAP